MAQSVEFYGSSQKLVKRSASLIATSQQYSAFDQSCHLRISCNKLPFCISPKWSLYRGTWEWDVSAKLPTRHFSALESCHVEAKLSTRWCLSVTMSRNFSFYKKIPFLIIILVFEKNRYQNIQLSYRTEKSIFSSQYSGLLSIHQMSEFFTHD